MSRQVEPRHLVAKPGALGDALVLIGVVLTAVMDSIASTALSIGRLDMLGDIHATSDEFATFDIAFLAAKLTGFLVAPLFVAALKPTPCLRAGAVALLLASAAMISSADIAWIDFCRIVQGFAGATVLVAGQTLLFLRFPSRQQPIVQAVLALGSVMAPTTVTPALQGWLVDHLSWDWIFLSNVPVGIVALVMLAADRRQTFRDKIRLPYPQVALAGLAAASLTYVSQQGSRFNWFDDGHITLFTLSGLLAVILLLLWEFEFTSDRSILPTSPLGDPDFRFALVVSLVAGFALSGSAFLIPAFALNVLAFTATDAGTLLLPSGVILGCTLLVAGLGVQKCGINPLALAPVGVVFFASSMGFLSGSTSDSGTVDLEFPLLLRGFGLGLLFISLTLFALMRLPAKALPFGIGLFALGKQVGGLTGTALLQTYLDRQLAYNRTILTSHLAIGDVSLEERLKAVAGQLAARGLDSVVSGRAALSLLRQAADRQAIAISFNEAFFALVLLFLIAAPCLVIARRVLGRRSSAQGLSRI
ncbi:MFS transporter [Mesorhizobium opportunistum]|uniref:Major facilitator superfamily MFS_1 n=1 Tax=Mesorhizobium opportunistum (strain LMG 24607 / HAMBI 3007 / WSM2075) TaxID=536019 RepID=F7YAS5_MESOW|nr:MFS transporter [Mesorhizobium opportunistum]AEH88835.1 major facilitator superfamily MFS_1 [Mesorhizobium opportunistum WSM2075]